MTESRPSLQRKHTRSTEAKREALMDETFAIRVNDEVYSITPADLTGLVEFRIRRETGMSVEGIVTALSAEPGVDYLGMFMWACKVAAGEDVSLESVLASVSWAAEVDVIDNAEPASPEA